MATSTASLHIYLQMQEIWRIQYQQPISSVKEETLFPVCTLNYESRSNYLTIRIGNLVQTLQVVQEAGWSQDVR